jgi:hypothetical protein
VTQKIDLRQFLTDCISRKDPPRISNHVQYIRVRFLFLGGKNFEIVVSEGVHGEK